MKGLTSGRIYRFLEWIMWIMYLNLLWIIFTLLGLGVLGVFPATLALVITIRQWILYEDIRFTHTYFVTFKTYFVKANSAGYILCLIGYILWVDINFLSNVTFFLQPILFILTLIVTLILGVTACYLFPVMAHFEIKFWQGFKYAMIIGVFSPVITIILLFSLYLLPYIWRVVPGLLPFVGVSITFYIVTKLSLFAFEQFAKKQERIYGPNSSI